MNLDKIELLGNRVLLKVKDPEETKLGNISLGIIDTDFTCDCEVVKVGNGSLVNDLQQLNWSFSVKEGDTVTILKKSGYQINLDGTDYIIIKEIEILARQ